MTDDELKQKLAVNTGNAYAQLDTMLALYTNQRQELMDAAEALRNIEINAHFFQVDNTTMHPAHSQLLTQIEIAANRALAHIGFPTGADEGGRPAPEMPDGFK